MLESRNHFCPAPQCAPNGIEARPCVIPRGASPSGVALVLSRLRGVLGIGVRVLIKKPPDIPTTPNLVYAGNWIDWADWLGHSRRIGKWRAFSAATQFARSLHLSSRKDWLVLVDNRKNGKSNGLPDDIPSVPEHVYEEWVGWWDWLGTRVERSTRLPRE